MTQRVSHSQSPSRPFLHQTSTSHMRRSPSPAPSPKIHSTRAPPPTIHSTAQLKSLRSPSPSRRTYSAKTYAPPSAHQAVQPPSTAYRIKEPSTSTPITSHNRRHSTSASFESLSAKNSQEDLFYTPRQSTTNPIASYTRDYDPSPPSYALHQHNISSHSHQSTIPSRQSGHAISTPKQYTTTTQSSRTFSRSSHDVSRSSRDDSFSSAMSSYPSTHPAPPNYQYPLDSVSQNARQKADNVSYLLSKPKRTDSYLDRNEPRITPVQDEYASMRQSGSSSNRIVSSTPRERRRQEKIDGDVTEAGRKRRDSVELPQVTTNTNTNTKGSANRSSSVAECLNYAETKDDLIRAVHRELTPKSKLYNLLKRKSM